MQVPLCRRMVLSHRLKLLAVFIFGFGAIYLIVDYDILPSVEDFSISFADDPILLVLNSTISPQTANDTEFEDTGLLRCIFEATKNN